MDDSNQNKLADNLLTELEEDMKLQFDEVMKKVTELADRFEHEA